MAVSPSAGTHDNKGRQFRLPLLRADNCDDSTASPAADVRWLFKPATRAEGPLLHVCY